MPDLRSSLRLTPFRGVLLVSLLLPTPARGVASSVAPPRVDSTLLVLAASSLADVLPPLAEAWSAGSGVAVALSFDATSRLARQAVQTSGAGVFVSADAEWIAWLEERGAILPGSARLIAANRLVVVTPTGAPPLAGPSELASVSRLALSGENVPAGRYARAALESQGLWPTIAARVVRGGSVRSTLEWVARGEVPAGIVYATDARAEPGVTVAFAFEPSDHPPIGYYAAQLGAGDRAGAGFVEFLGSASSAGAFAAAGFVEVGLSQGPALGASMSAALPSIGSAIRLSIVVALIATLLGLVPAVGLGWLLARRDFPGKSVVSTLVLAPLVMPPVVTGFLLLTLLGSNTPIGGALASLGLPVPFTWVGAAIAAFVVGLPLYVISIRGAFEAVDPFYEELSWTLGSPPRETFFRISLPLALPGIAAGAVLAFARALGEFGATVVLAGNVEGSTRTIALAVYTLLETPDGRDAIWVLIGASVGISLLALLGFEALTRRQRARLERHRVR